MSTAIANGPEAWHRELAGKQAEERLRFGLLTIDRLGEHWCPSLYNWRDVLLECCQMVGLQRLLVEKWSNGGPFISLLVKFGFNALLAEALNTYTGWATLLRPDHSGDTALHVAAEYSNVEAARLILNFDDAQGTLRMKPNLGGRLPIHRAAFSEAPDIVALLLTLKGKEQRLAAAGASGRLPIHEATSGCKPHKTQLSEGSVPFWTPVLSRNGDVAVVRILLEDCAHQQVTARISSWGGIPLMSTGSPEVAALLLGVKSAVKGQLTLRNDYGSTALEMAKAGAKVTGNTAVVSIIDAMMKREAPAPSSRSRRSSKSGTSSTSSTSSTSTTSAGLAPAVNGGALSPMPYPPPLGENILPFAEEGSEALDL